MLPGSGAAAHVFGQPAVVLLGLGGAQHRAAPRCGRSCDALPGMGTARRTTWLVAILVAPSGCTERLVYDVQECAARNPEPLWTFGANEFISRTVTQPLGGGMLVTVNQYDTDVSTLARTVGIGPEPEPYGSRTLWVGPCGDSYVVAEDLKVWRDVRPEGPWVASDAETSWLIRDLRRPPVLEPLPGDAVWGGAFDGDVLAREPSGRAYRWNPDDPPETRTTVMENAARLFPHALPPRREIFVQDEEGGVWAIDLLAGAREKLSDTAKYGIAYRNGDFLSLAEGYPGGGIESRIRLFDRRRHRSVVLSESGYVFASHVVTGGDWLVLGEGVPPDPITTILVYLPDVEIVRLPGHYQLASGPFVPQLFLTDEDRTYRFDPATHTLEPILAFPAIVEQQHAAVSYLTRSADLDGDGLTEYQLLRTDDLDGDHTPELLIEHSDLVPIPLWDGRWAFFRAEGERDPGELLLLDPRTKATQVLARNVPFAFAHWTAFAHRDRRGSTALVYATIEPGEGGTLWHYHVPPP